MKQQTNSNAIRPKNNQPLRTFLATLTLAGLMLGTGNTNLAVTTIWNPQIGSQNWFSAGNWSPSLPTASDTAIFIGANASVEGSTAATAADLSIVSGAVTIGDFDTGTLNVGGQIAVTGGRLGLNYGTVSLNTLAVGTSGTYFDTKSSTLALTGTNPTIKMASVNVVVNSQITGSNGLIATGPGTLVLANANSYTGGTTISNVSTFQVGNGGTTGSLGAGEVANSGTLVFSRSDSAVVSNLISGTGSVRQAGSGTSILTADNSYSGGTTISAGTLQVGNGGTTGAVGTGNVTNNGALVFNRSDDIVFETLVSGSGSLAQAGSGTLTLTGNNTYGGATTISNGTLQVGDGGPAGSLGAGNVNNNGALVFNRSDSIVVANQIGGSGSLTQAGSNTLTLSGNNTYSGGTVVSAGTVQVGNTRISGSLGSGNVTNNGSLIFNRSDTIVIANPISGTGSVEQAGSGTMAVTGNNTYSGTTTISSGTLQVGNGGTTGALGTGNVTNNGSLIFNRSDRIVMANPIGGTGSLQQAGSGTLTLTTDNSYSGGTTISAGALQVGDGGTTGSLGTNGTTNNARLIFNRSDSLSVDSVIGGTGSVRHSGSGTLTLTGNNTYAGGMSVDGGGTLRIINSSALGTGDLNLTNGTIKADAPSLTNRTTVTVGGNYAQSGGTALELGIGGAGNNESDQVRVTGRAAVNGTLRLVALGTYRPLHNTKLVLVSAGGGVTGRFSTFANNFSSSPLLDPQLKYNPNDVTLAFEHVSFQPYAATRNQQVVAEALDSLVASTSSDDTRLIDSLDYDYLADLRNGLRGAFDKISPEGLTAMFGTAFAVMDLQGDQFLKRAGELRADYPAVYSTALRNRAASTAAFDNYVNNPWSLYLELPFSSVRVTGDSEARGYDVSTRGVTLGLDRRVGDHAFVGVSGAYSNSKADLADGGRVDTDSFGLNAYAGWFKQGLHLVGMAGGCANSFDIKRQSLGDVARGSTKSLAWTGLVGAGYDWQKGPWQAGPQVDVQYMSAGIDKFTETGSLFPLQISSQKTAALHSQIGLNLRCSQLLKPWTILTPQCYFGWRHDFKGDRFSLDSQSASGAGNVFTVYGPKLGTESIIGSVGFSLQWRPAVNTALNYTRQIGRKGYEANNVKLAARLSF